MPENAAPHLRLLFVSSLPRWGGRERWLLQAASGLAARGHDVQVAARPGSKILARASAAGLRRHAVRSERAFDPRTLVAMHRLLTRPRPHAVFVQLDRELLAVVLAARGSPPLVFQKRGPQRAHHATGPRSFLARRLTRTLTHTEHARTWLCARAGCRAGDVDVIHDGVPLDAVPQRSDRDRWRRTLKLPRESALVLHVGMMESGKGQDTTLRALAVLRATRSGSVPTVAFVGTGPEEARLRDLCHQLGLREHVLWVGFRTDISAYLAAADLLVLPTQSAGWSRTVLEAMALRLPVVASDVEGRGELLRDGHNAVLVPPGDPAALARAVARVLDDANLAATLAAHAWQTVHDDWDLEAMLDDLECLVYAHLLRRRARVPRAALFVDRDDTLIRDVPYGGDPGAVLLLPGAVRALRWVHAAGLAIVVVSNQSGVAQGRITEADVRAVNARVDALLRAHGIGLDGVYWCPHHPEFSGTCACRKPEPGLLLRAARELGIDLASSLTVGNSARDLEAGIRAGTEAVGYRGAGVDADLPATATSYTSWTRLVRDFLQRRFTR